MPADEPTDGEIEINGKTYKAQFCKWTIPADAKTFGEHVDTIQISGTISGVVCYNTNEPDEYNDRLRRPPMN